MKDNFCNDSSSSIDLCTNNAEIVTTSSSAELTNQSTSNTNLSSSLRSSQNDVCNKNIHLNNDTHVKIETSGNIKNNRAQNPEFAISFSDSEYESNLTSSDEESFTDASEYNMTNNSVSKRTNKKSMITYESFEQDYDKQIDFIIEKATKLMENDALCIKCGLYQFLSFIFISITWAVANGWYAYANVFAGYPSTHTCKLDDYNSSESNLTKYIVDEEQCKYSDVLTNLTHKCEKWSYDKTYMKSTIITEFNFVCENNYKFEIGYSLEQTGYIVGTLIFSVIADKMGRKPVFIVVLTAMTVFGILQFFVTNFYLYMVIGFIINIFASGVDSVSVPLVLEMFDIHKRTAYGMGMEYIWVLVLTSFSLFSYMINTWRYLRLFIFVILAVITLASYWLVQESVTWLISTNKIKEASAIIDWVAKFNCLWSTDKFKKRKNKLNEHFQQLKIYNEVMEKVKESQSKMSTVKVDKTGKKYESEVTYISNNNKGAFMDILKNSKYRLYVIIMSLNWFATGLIYDGLTYLNSFVGENIFISWTLMNIIELPAQIICHFCLARVGRRITTCVSLIICGTTLIITSIISIALPEMNKLKLVLYLIAKFSSTQAYSSVIIHAPEIFPTHLRSFGYGICLFFGKVTAVLSPITSLYLAKLFPWLPPVIYGIIGIICGFTCLYIPETLNRPLPNSIDDVLKWSRILSAEERQKAKQLSKIECKILSNIKNFFCKTRSASISIEPSKRANTQNTIVLVSVNDLENG